MNNQKARKLARNAASRNTSNTLILAKSYTNVKQLDNQILSLSNILYSKLYFSNKNREVIA